MTPVNLLCLAKACSLDDDVLANLAIAVISFYKMGQLHSLVESTHAWQMKRGQFYPIVGP